MTTDEPLLGVRSVEKPLARVGPYFAAMRYEHRLMAAAMCCMVLLSCKKDKDPTLPVVTILAPGNGFELVVPSTLHVVADVSAEDGLDHVLFSMSNANGFPIIEPFSVVPASNPARVEVDIPITSDLIASGEYTLLVQASAGDGSGRDQVQVAIIGTPLRVRRVFAISEPGANTASLHFVDSTGAVSAASTLAMDLTGASVSSAAQTVAVMGGVQGPLVAYAPDGSTVKWQKPNLGNAGIPWFTSLDLCADGRFYVGTTDGTLRGYNASTGSTERVCDLLANHRSQVSTIVGERLVSAQVDQGTSAWRIVSYQASSGAYITEHSIGQRVVALFPLTDAQVLIFGNTDGVGSLQAHDLDAGGGWEPYAWGAEITAVERLDENTFMVALADGSLERFTWSNAGSVNLATIPDLRDLALNEVNGTLFGAAGDQVIGIQPATGQVLASYPIGAPVRYALPLLNR